MALINCPECNREVSDKAASCPHCGYKLNPIEEQTKSVDSEGDVQKEKEKKSINIKTILILLCAVILIGVICVAAIKILNSPIRKAKTAYQSEDLETYKSLLGDLTEEEKDELSDMIKSDVDNLYNAYVGGETDADEVKSALDLKKSYEIEKGYIEEKTEKIASFVKMDESYNKALDNVDNAKYVDAYKELSSINDEEYKNYSAVQEKKQEIESLAVKEASEQIQKMMNGDDLKSANDYASDILETDLSDEALVKLCKNAVSEYDKKKKAEEKAKKEAEEAERQLTDGKGVNTGHLEVTYVSGSFTSKILPSSTYGYYTYFEPQNPSNTYFAMKFTIKNTSNRSYDMYDVFSVDTARFGGSTYNYSVFYNYQGSTSMENIYSWDAINPQETVIMYLAFEVPSSKQNESVDVDFRIDGKELELKK